MMIEKISTRGTRDKEYTHYVNTAMVADMLVRSHHFT